MSTGHNRAHKTPFTENVLFAIIFPLDLKAVPPCGQGGTIHLLAVRNGLPVSLHKGFPIRRFHRDCLFCGHRWFYKYTPKI
ncbi:hypothetical protein ANACOL_02649 [Anaerotruncus colihominis DSM 17241]|uniref:Uncharacterized protein n=1 Tax=Anaerotruncus colihominis DSM 17241 TaxID=445972 RepID=B0PCY6_9FIRM|nr:hypothetical protein ANACOL_02649 [Anaerotruncus colihominis DSM 17241]